MTVIKKLLIAFLVIYVVVTSTYFIYKYAPYIEQYFKGTVAVVQETPKEEQKEEVKAPEKECASFAIGHIAIDQFRVQTRFLASASADSPAFSQNDLQAALSTLSCDKARQKALIYYDSKPVAIASIQSFDYSKPLADGSDMKPEFYTVLKVEKKLANFPDNGYVIAVYDYYDSRMDFYNSTNQEVTDQDESLISGSCSTIYYQVVGEDPQKTEVEYAAIKGPLNMSGIKDLAVLATWTGGPGLPKGINYTAVFNLHINKDGSASRHPLFPITKMRNSTLHLEQMLDLNNDGYMEVVVRKNRDGNDTFMIYRYDRDKDAYISEGDQLGE
jgi:hypothetical protein